MGHAISAALLKGEVDLVRAASFELCVIPLDFQITLFPLDPVFVDHWMNILDVQGFVNRRPLVNANVVHAMVRDISLEPDPLYAILETSYSGGHGEQCAAVYRGGAELSSPQVAASGPINAALRDLGVVAQGGSDEFDTIGLGTYRDFDELFERYRCGE